VVSDLEHRAGQVGEGRGQQPFRFLLNVTGQQEAGAPPPQPQHYGVVIVIGTGAGHGLRSWVQDLQQRPAPQDHPLPTFGGRHRHPFDLQDLLPLAVGGRLLSELALKHPANLIALDHGHQPCQVIPIAAAEHDHVDSVVPEGHVTAQLAEGDTGVGAAVHQDLPALRASDQDAVALYGKTNTMSCHSVWGSSY